MLESILKSISSEQALVFLFARKEGYAREITRFFDTSLDPIQKQLEKMEAGGVLVSRKVGRTRLFTFNPRYAFLEELKALLEKALSFYPPEEQEKLLMNRRRPRKSGKPLGKLTGSETSMKLYNIQSRQETLEKLREALQADLRIGGALLVGSGAHGFKDEFSDIDLAVVVSEKQDVLTVFKDWDVIIRELLPVLWSFADIRGPEVGLYGFLLEDFLEVDISFQPLSMLTARSPNWKVLFDRTGQIEERLHASEGENLEPDLETLYTRRLDSIWHYVTNTAVSIKRGHLWRARHYLEEIRNRTIELKGLGENGQALPIGGVDHLPADWLAVLEGTIPMQLTCDELVRALHAATDSFFEVAEEIDKANGSTQSKTLREAMGQYLALLG